MRHGDKCRGDRPDGPGATAESFRTLDDRNRPEDMRIECGSFEEYMVHAQRLFELYGITNVYIATDDADVVDRARRDPCYAHFDFYFQKYERLIAPQYSYVDPDAPDFVQYGLEECQNAGHRKDRLKCPLDRDRFDETKSMVVDLGVLAKADAFVGSLWSNVGRLSYELSAADKGCLPPLISRDVGWCSVDGQLQDGTVYGHLNC